MNAEIVMSTFCTYLDDPLALSMSIFMCHIYITDLHMLNLTCVSEMQSSLPEEHIFLLCCWGFVGFFCFILFFAEWGWIFIQWVMEGKRIKGLKNREREKERGEEVGRRERQKLHFWERDGKACCWFFFLLRFSWEILHLCPSKV